MQLPLETQIGDLLRQKGWKLATAESCTGGLLGHRITDIPGSSDYYLGGVVAYAYEAKVTVLGVSWETLQKHGAVSRETVLEMAQGARTLLGADIAISISGIAGPGGATPDKPVGTTWFGLSTAEGEWARVHRFRGGRAQNKAASTQAALQFILDALTGFQPLEGDYRSS